MTRRPIQVVIADDHAVVRDGLRALIDAQPDMSVVGEAADGEEAWQRARELQPDVLVLDLSMPRVSGLEAAETIARDCPDVRIVALTMHEERGYATRMLGAGAVGYVLKRAASSDLVRAIRAVAAGERYVDPSLAGSLLSDGSFSSRSESRADDPPRASSLTPRESEVLRLLALGHSNKEIAAALSISVKTVETHRASGMTRLGVTTRAALVRFALAEGWLRDQ
jgi:DNA-binding NarL/FixJ family response regulator